MDEVSIKRRTPLATNLQVKNNSPSHQASDAKTKRAIEKIKDKLNLRYKGVKTPIEKKHQKAFGASSEKTIRVATKLKDP